MDVIDRTFNLKSDTLPIIDEISEETAFDSVRHDDNFKYGVDRLDARGSYTQFSYPILSHEFITGLVKLFKYLNVKNVVELCSGPGWLSHWITKYGFPITAAVDNMSWECWKEKDYLPFVKKRDAIRYAAYHSEVDLFILSWPYMDSTAVRIWRRLKRRQLLLYIGEGDGGCTANDKFFNETRKYRIRCEPFDNLYASFESFYGIHDYPELFQK